MEIVENFTKDIKGWFIGLFNEALKMLFRKIDEFYSSIVFPMPRPREDSEEYEIWLGIILRNFIYGTTALAFLLMLCFYFLYVFKFKLRKFIGFYGLSRFVFMNLVLLVLFDGLITRCIHQKDPSRFGYIVCGISAVIFLLILFLGIGESLFIQLFTLCFICLGIWIYLLKIKYPMILPLVPTMALLTKSSLVIGMFIGLAMCLIFEVCNSCCSYFKTPCTGELYKKSDKVYHLVAKYIRQYSDDKYPMESHFPINAV